MNYRKEGVIATFDWRANEAQAYPGIRLSDEVIYQMVDDGIEEVCFLLREGRFFSSLDDWLDRAHDDTSEHRSMPFTMMDKR